MINKLKSKSSDKLTKDQIYEIIKDFIVSEKELAIRRSIGDESFESPAWSEKQAYSMGMIKMCEKILNFIPNKEQAKNV